MHVEIFMERKITLVEFFLLKPLFSRRIIHFLAECPMMLIKIDRRFLLKCLKTASSTENSTTIAGRDEVLIYVFYCYS